MPLQSQVDALIAQRQKPTALRPGMVRQQDVDRLIAQKTAGPPPAPSGSDWEDIGHGIQGWAGGIVKQIPVVSSVMDAMGFDSPIESAPAPNAFGTGASRLLSNVSRGVLAQRAGGPIGLGVQTALDAANQARARRESEVPDMGPLREGETRDQMLERMNRGGYSGESYLGDLGRGNGILSYGAGDSGWKQAARIARPFVAGGLSFLSPKVAPGIFQAGNSLATNAGLAARQTLFDVGTGAGETVLSGAGEGHSLDEMGRDLRSSAGITTLGSLLGHGIGAARERYAMARRPGGPSNTVGDFDMGPPPPAPDMGPPDLPIDAEVIPRTMGERDNGGLPPGYGVNTPPGWERGEAGPGMSGIDNAGVFEVGPDGQAYLRDTPGDFPVGGNFGPADVRYTEFKQRMAGLGQNLLESPYARNPDLAGIEGEMAAPLPPPDDRWHDITNAPPQGPRYYDLTPPPPEVMPRRPQPKFTPPVQSEPPVMQQQEVPNNGTQIREGAVADVGPQAVEGNVPEEANGNAGGSRGAEVSGQGRQEGVLTDQGGGGGLSLSPIPIVPKHAAYAESIGGTPHRFVVTDAEGGQHGAIDVTVTKDGKIKFGELIGGIPGDDMAPVRKLVQDRLTASGASKPAQVPTQTNDAPPFNDLEFGNDLFGEEPPPPPPPAKPKLQAPAEFTDVPQGVEYGGATDQGHMFTGPDLGFKGSRSSFVVPEGGSVAAKYNQKMNEVRAANGLPTQPKEQINAEEIRSDQGQNGSQGHPGQAGQNVGGEDLQLAAQAGPSAGHPQEQVASVGTRATEAAPEPRSAAQKPEPAKQAALVPEEPVGAPAAVEVQPIAYAKTRARANQIVKEAGGGTVEKRGNQWVVLPKASGKAAPSPKAAPKRAKGQTLGTGFGGAQEGLEAIGRGAKRVGKALRHISDLYGRNEVTLKTTDYGKKVANHLQSMITDINANAGGWHVQAEDALANTPGAVKSWAQDWRNFMEPYEKGGAQGVIDHARKTKGEKFAKQVEPFAKAFEKIDGEIGDLAISRDVQMTDDGKKVPFKKLKNHFRHAFSKEIKEAAENGPGDPVYDALIKQAKTHGADPDDVIQTIRRSFNEQIEGSLERPRKALSIPYEITVGNRKVPVWNSNPFEVLNQQIEGAARRLGIIKYFDQFKADEKVSEMANKLWESAGAGKGGKLRDAFLDVWDQLNGHARFREANKELEKIISIAKPGENIARVAQLSGAVVSNALGGWVPSAVRAGGINTVKAFAQTVANSLANRLPGNIQLKSQAEIDVIRGMGASLKDVLGGIGETEDISGAARKIGDRVHAVTGFTGANRMINTATALAAVHDFADKIHALRSTGNDTAIKKIMGVDKKEIRQQLKDEYNWTDAEIDRMKDNGINYKDFAQVAQDRKSKAYMDLARVAQSSTAKGNVFRETPMTRRGYLTTRGMRMVQAYTSYLRARGQQLSDNVRAAKRGNLVPLVRNLVGSALAGMLIDKSKEWLMGREHKDDTPLLIRLADWWLEAGTFGMAGGAAEDAYWAMKTQRPSFVTIAQWEWLGQAMLGAPIKALKKGLKEGSWGDGLKELYIQEGKQIPAVKYLDARFKGLIKKRAEETEEKFPSSSGPFEAAWRDAKGKDYEWDRKNSHPSQGGGVPAAPAL